MSRYKHLYLILHRNLLNLGHVTDHLMRRDLLYPSHLITNHQSAAIHFFVRGPTLYSRIIFSISLFVLYGEEGGGLIQVDTKMVLLNSEMKDLHIMKKDICTREVFSHEFSEVKYLYILIYVRVGRSK